MSLCSQRFSVSSFWSHVAQGPDILNRSWLDSGPLLLKLKSLVTLMGMYSFLLPCGCKNKEPHLVPWNTEMYPTVPEMAASAGLVPPECWEEESIVGLLLEYTKCFHLVFPGLLLHHPELGLQFPDQCMCVCFPFTRVSVTLRGPCPTPAPPKLNTYLSWPYFQIKLELQWISFGRIYFYPHKHLHPYLFTK